MLNPKPPAITEAEATLVERYARIVELLGRINPARTASNIHGCLRAAAALEAEAQSLHAALVTMHERGENEMFNQVFSDVLSHLQIDRHVARLNSLASPLSQ